MREERKVGALACSHLQDLREDLGKCFRLRCVTRLHVRVDGRDVVDCEERGEVPHAAPEAKALASRKHGGLHPIHFRVSGLSCGAVHGMGVSFSVSVGRGFTNLEGLFQHPAHVHGRSLRNLQRERYV
jgi:hypothetical protein